MPPLLAPAIAGLAAGIGIAGLGAEITVAGVGIGLSVASALAYGITAVASIGASYALNKLLAKKPPKGDPSISQLTIKQPVPYRQRFYGRCKIGGAFFFEAANPAPGANLLLGIIHGEGPIDGFEAWFLNDTFSTSSGGTNTSAPWLGLIGFDERTGTDTQTVSGLLTPYGFTGTLSGLAYTVMQCSQPPIPAKQFQFFYPNGIPSIRVVARGVKIYDPRDGGQDWDDPTTWLWSRNPALICLDYLTYGKFDADGVFIPRGMGLPKSRMNLTSFSAFADLCDEVVPTRYSIDSSGNVTDTPSSIPRYSCDGLYDMSQTPTDVLDRILQTCDAHLYTLPDGSVGIRGGKWTVPSVTIDDSMIIAADFSQGNDRFTIFNQLKISLSAPYMDFQLVEGHTYDDLADQDENGILAQELSLPYVQSDQQSRRIAKITMAKGNPKWRYSSLVCTLATLNAIGEEFVHLTHTLAGIDDDFLILNVKISNMLVEFQLASIDSTAYDWDPATEDRVPQTSGTVPPEAILLERQAA